MPKGFLLHRPSTLTMGAPNPKKRLLHCALIEFAEMVSHDMRFPPSPVSPASTADSPINLTTNIPQSPPVRTVPETPLTLDYLHDMPVLPTKYTTTYASPATKTNSTTATADYAAGRHHSLSVQSQASSATGNTQLTAVVPDHEKTTPSISLPVNKRLCTTKFTCKLCRLNFSDPLSLARHVCAAIRPVEYRCPECDKVFNNPANLASHRRWHKPSASQQLECPLCAQLFRRNSLLKKHLETEHPTHRQGQRQELHRQQQQHQNHPQIVSQKYSKEVQDETAHLQCHLQSTPQGFLPSSKQSHNQTVFLVGDQSSPLSPLRSHANLVIHGLIHHPESPFMPPLPGIY
ncbi:zinc finger protein 774-like [Varroa jacobsoni]|uniref:zinc finger protein 774-like n=1 Tax=Varroa jacobsoni TaxID=62625 RepID=UPI000BF25BA7|nr:zinc finger protein 774-like [Varroa jacobsoni]